MRREEMAEDKRKKKDRKMVEERPGKGGQEGEETEEGE